MRIARNRHVEGKDGTLVLTDGAGKAVTCAKAQTVQKQVSMSPLGERGGLPTRQLATGCGFKTRQAYDDSRHAGLQGALAALWPKRPGPHHPAQRTQEVEALLLRTRVETDGNM